MLGRIRRSWLRGPSRSGVHGAVFTEIYRTGAWGDSESVSGPGSGLQRTAALRAELAKLIDRLGVKSMLDAGCGDFHWMKAADLGLDSYVGVDVVESLIAHNRRLHSAPGRTFMRADITRDRLPCADLVLCRECVVHFPDADVKQTLANFCRSGSRYLLATTFTERSNTTIEVGGWRPLNVQAPPFDLPEPLLTIPDVPVDGSYADKRLALWRLEDLRSPAR